MHNNDWSVPSGKVKLDAALLQVRHNRSCFSGNSLHPLSYFESSPDQHLSKMLRSATMDSSTQQQYSWLKRGEALGRVLCWFGHWIRTRCAPVFMLLLIPSVVAAHDPVGMSIFFRDLC